DGTASSFAVDGRGLVTAIHHDDGSQALPQESSYEYDAAGRCVCAVDSWSDDGRQCHERRRSYRYDALGRLCREESWCEGLAAYCYSQESSYDATGNRIRAVHTDERGAMTVRAFEYDANDRLLKEEVQNAAESYQILYSWDANGSLLSRVAGGAYPDERRYTWDAENRLVAVHIDQPNAASGAVHWSIFYDYDARGMLCGCTRERRQNQLVERSRYRLVMTPPEPDGMPVLLECQLLEGMVDESLQSFVQGGRLLARYGADSDAWQCAGDRLGTVTCERSGATRVRQGYDARGMPLLPSRETPGHGFAGEWQDPVTGLVYLRSRFYAPELGAFISRDAHPGQLSQPMSLHKYAYCLNDPVNRCDPGGCFSMLSCMSAMCTHMSSACNTFIRYRVPLQIATELSWGVFSLSDFMTREAEKTNATVVVHGVMPHFPGYSKDLTGGLEGRIDNQDYYEFLWSGFAMAIIPWLPNPLQHGIAKASLRSCLLAIEQKGYRHLSLIGHSWGTVLSLDALEQRDVPIHTWVTMGSPLPRVTPRFSFRNWLNVFSASDPVVYLQMQPFFRFSSEPMEPLFAQESPPEQHGVGNRPLLEAHSCYWTDYMTIKLIANLLKAQ
ncbi:MAG: RHS repeat-associated core domain-containing protein, partial [Kiritimatiellae bacterium]|nr:RHS repeat-associated core domain-containing protein [Kiritimatiellia bacterium]